MATLQIYVKPTSNCEGMSLQTFETLSPIWTGEKIRLPFGEPPKVKRLEVCGWTDLFCGQACPVHVAKVHAGNSEGYLVYGGNLGVRILSNQAKPTPGIDNHLPRGYGQPIIWLADSRNLPRDVRKVVGK